VALLKASRWHDFGSDQSACGMERYLCTSRKGIDVSSTGKYKILIPTKILIPGSSLQNKNFSGGRTGSLHHISSQTSTPICSHVWDSKPPNLQKRSVPICSPQRVELSGSTTYLCCVQNSLYKWVCLQAHHQKIGSLDHGMWWSINTIQNCIGPAHTPCLWSQVHTSTPSERSTTCTW
jgi:hypothetical protein